MMDSKEITEKVSKVSTAMISKKTQPEVSTGITSEKIVSTVTDSEINVEKTKPETCTVMASEETTEQAETEINSAVVTDSLPLPAMLKESEDKNSSEVNTEKQIVVKASKFRPKDIVSGTITEIQPQNMMIYVTIDGSDETGCIHIRHLSDDAKISKSLFDLIKIGDTIKNAIVLSIREEVILTMKPTIFQFRKTDTETDIKCGDIFPAIISLIGCEGIKVDTFKGEFGSTFNIAKCDLVEGDLNIRRMGIYMGRTVFVKCIDIVDKTPILSTWLSHVMHNKEWSSFQYLFNALSIRSQMQTGLEMKINGSRFANVQVGNTYQGEVIAVIDQGVLIHIPSLLLDGVIDSKHSPVKAKENDVLDVVVLGVNYEERCLELSTRTDIDVCATKDHQIKVGDQYVCEVLLAKRDYILTRLETCNGQIVYLPSKRHWNDFKGRNSFYEIGRKYEIKVKFIKDQFILADLIYHNLSISDPLYVDTETPSFHFKEESSSTCVRPLILNIHSCPIDREARAIEKIKKATQFLVSKKNKEETMDFDHNRFILMEDKFPQENDEFFWNYVVKKRYNQSKSRALSKQLGIVDVKRNIDEVDVDMGESSLEQPPGKIMKTEATSTNTPLKKPKKRKRKNPKKQKKKSYFKNKAKRKQSKWKYANSQFPINPNPNYGTFGNSGPMATGGSWNYSTNEGYIHPSDY